MLAASRELETDMLIDTHAPATAHDAIEIAADANRVWDLLADIDHWPLWHPAVSRARTDGPVAPGTVFRWKAGGIAITSTLREVEPGRALAWTGHAIGADAVHGFTLTPTASGVRVATEESLDGWLVRLTPGTFRKTLQKGLAEMLAALKAAAETKN